METNANKEHLLKQQGDFIFKCLTCGEIFGVHALHDKNNVYLQGHRALEEIRELLQKGQYIKIYSIIKQVLGEKE